jgi:hypothetical protein
MLIVVYIVIVLLIVTKLLDVLSTIRRIRNASAETNPIARKMMYRFGTTKSIWMFFILALIIITITGFMAIRETLVFQILFVTVGIFISTIQFAVAICNWTGVDNLVTKRIRKFHSFVRQLLTRKL